MLQMSFDDDHPVVEVVRSARRRKTISARVVGGILRVSIPASMTRAEEEECVSEMVGRMQRKARTRHIDLPERAEVLATRYGLRRPSSIRWVDNQEHRWGSCTPVDGTIRISSAMAGFPSWVIDAVIVHELAHLQVHGHGPAFKAIMARYPKAELARGFLIAKGLENDDE